MTYSPVLLIHICGGVIGILAGSTALATRKGSSLHRRSGVVFVVAMLIMASAGAYVALTKSQTTNVIGGTITFYLVATAWLTVIRKDKETGRLELGLLLLGLAAGIGSLICAWQAVHSPAGPNTALAIPCFVFGAMAMLATAGDVRMLIRGGVSGTKRLVRHLWRMCVALFIAVASFFLGASTDPVLRKSGLRATLFTPEIRHTHLPEVPVLIVVVLTIFWLFRVWFGKAYKNPRPDVHFNSQPKRVKPSPSVSTLARFSHPPRFD